MLVGENVGKFGKSMANCQSFIPTHSLYLETIHQRFLLQIIQSAELATVFRYMVANYACHTRPGPTRACALPSTFQALPSAAQHDSCDSINN